MTIEQIIVKEKNFVKVAKLSDIKIGAMKNIEYNNRDILLANVDGVIYAMDDRCGHMNALLSMGKLQGKKVTCPFHYGEFDVTTGKKINGPVKESFKDMDKLPEDMQKFLVYAQKLIDPVKTYDIQTYTTKIDGDDILLKI